MAWPLGLFCSNYAASMLDFIFIHPVYLREAIEITGTLRDEFLLKLFHYSVASNRCVVVQL